MLGALVLVVVLVGIAALTRGGGGFTPGFATLLRDPSGSWSGLVPFVTGHEHVAGEYEGRRVVMEVRRKRGRYQLGSVTLAMQPSSGVVTGPGGEGAFLWELVRDDEGREALSRLEKRLGLRLELADGWLRATWMPVGLLLNFPGRFEEERWRTALDLMHRAARSIEARAISA